jgi:hypothetical protein
MVKLTFTRAEVEHITKSAEGYGMRLATFIRLVFWRGLETVNRCGIPNPRAIQITMPLNGKAKNVFDKNGSKSWAAFKCR